MDSYRTTLFIEGQRFRSPWYDRQYDAELWAQLVTEANEVCGGPAPSGLHIEHRQRCPEYVRCQDGSFARVEELPGLYTD